MSGGGLMAYETKVILAMLAERISNATSIEEAYEVIRNAANVEGVQLPAYCDVINTNPRLKHGQRSVAKRRAFRVFSDACP